MPNNTVPASGEAVSGVRVEDALTLAQCYLHVLRLACEGLANENADHGGLGLVIDLVDREVQNALEMFHEMREASDV